MSSPFVNIVLKCFLENESTRYKISSGAHESHNDVIVVDIVNPNYDVLTITYA